MTPNRSRALVLILLLATAPGIRAQYVPPISSAPGPGVIDSALRAAEPALSPWDFGINERLRGEDKLGAGTTHAGSNYDFSAAPPSENNNDYWLSRLMPRVGYTIDWFSAVVEARSSYSFGDNRYNAMAAGDGLTDNNGSFQLELAYFTLGNLKAFPVTVKVGRQELNYGDQRLVGSAPWLNVPHTFDAVKVRYQDSLFGVDLFAANLVYDSADHFDKSHSQDTLSGAYFDFPAVARDAVTEAYLFARNVARGIVTEDWSSVPAPFRFPAPQDIYTLGFRSKTKPGAPGPWDYGVEAIGQFGDRTAVFPATTVAAALAAPRLKQEAWAFVVQGGYAWKGLPGSPRLAAIVSCASGDHNAADGQSETFQNLIPSNHGLYGAMDLSGLQNIEDYRLSATIKPMAGMSLALDLHQQFLETTKDYWYNVASVPRNTPGAASGSGRGFGINPTYSSDLGREADLIGGWTPARGLLLEIGLGHFFRGSYVKESFSAIGSKDTVYAYAQATLNL